MGERLSSWYKAAHLLRYREWIGQLRLVPAEPFPFHWGVAGCGVAGYFRETGGDLRNCAGNC